MTLVDANVLLYAVDRSSRHHGIAKAWLDGAPLRRETLALPWVCVQAFVRIATHPAIFPRPLTMPQALSIVEEWLSWPNVVMPRVGPDHLPVWKDVLLGSRTTGNLVNDAHLAALALQFDARVATFDADFARFAAVDSFRPGEPV